MEKLKKQFVLMVLVAMSLQLVTTRFVAMAYDPGDVVINEVAWAGTTAGSNDEWLELYNNSNSEIDLAGWSVEDDVTTVYTIESGTIAPHGYFLIEDAEEATSATAGSLASLSFANTGDALVLKDTSGTVIDEVNSGGEMWPAGVSDSKATMERIDPAVSGDLSENWADAVSGNGSTGRDGGEILGTPGSVNSTYDGGGYVSLSVDGAFFNPGDTVNVSVDAAGVSDLYAFGFEVNYDPTVLRFLSASEGDVLNSDGANTAFYSALENGAEGTLIVGDARLVNPASGVNGNGELMSLAFEVIGSDGDETDLSFAMTSYLADETSDVPVGFDSGHVMVGQISIGVVENLVAAEGSEAYSLALHWDAPADGADSYIVKRQAVDGSYVVLEEVTELLFTDDDAVVNGGNLVPGVTYSYQIFSVKNGVIGAPVTVTATETRGVTGDNNRSGRIDGRDVENLARNYGSAYGNAQYHPLLDTTYDGQIDGSDLIDIGVNFGMSM